uniref:Putative secreted protein n=1 Tax=Anopheles darlingi TaxID=43151 RepID=A0A2M4DIM6_ANODA
MRGAANSSSCPFSLALFSTSSSSSSSSLFCTLRSSLSPSFLLLPVPINLPSSFHPSFSCSQHPVRF